MSNEGKTEVGKRQMSDIRGRRAEVRNRKGQRSRVWGTSVNK